VLNYKKSYRVLFAQFQFKNVLFNYIDNGNFIDAANRIGLTYSMQQTFNEKVNKSHILQILQSGLRGNTHVMSFETFLISRAQLNNKF